MLDVKNGFVGVIDEKTIHDFTSNLDYNLEDNKKRAEYIKKILYTQNDGKHLDKYFEVFFEQNVENPLFNVNINANNTLSNKNYICKMIEYMTNYILFCNKSMEENKTSEYPYLNRKDRLQIERRERYYDKKLDTADKNEIDLVDKYNNITPKKRPMEKITKKDIAEIPYIAELYYAIEDLKLKLKEETDVPKINKIISMLKDLRREQIDIKNSIRRPINFLIPLQDTTVINYDSDTGYYRDDGSYKYVSFNRVDLANYIHVHNLLKYYSSLKQQTYFDLSSDIKYILMDLDSLINKTKLKPFERDLLEMKIDGASGKDIIDYVNNKYNLKLNDCHLSVVWTRIIPKKISQQYIDDYEDWFYTFKAKGEFKTCSRCKEVYLANSKYFGKNANTKDGFQSSCKICDNKRQLLRKTK